MLFWEKGVKSLDRWEILILLIPFFLSKLMWIKCCTCSNSMIWYEYITIFSLIFWFTGYWLKDSSGFSIPQSGVGHQSSLRKVNFSKILYIGLYTFLSLSLRSKKLNWMIFMILKKVHDECKISISSTFRNTNLKQCDCTPFILKSLIELFIYMYLT